MKNLKPLLVCSLALSLALPSLCTAASPVTRQGSDVLHLMVRNIISPTDLGPNTSGTMRMQYNQQGQSTKQSLDLLFTGLEANAAAGLTASIGEDTNVVTVHNFTSDDRGQVRASFMAKAPGSPRLGRKQALPELLNPLSNVRAICVENAAVELVGFAWNNDAPVYRYLVKRNLTPEDSGGTAAGSITLSANHKRAALRLLAGGLTPGAEYNLVFNGTVMETFTANDQGRLLINGWPADAPHPLLVRSLAVTDAEGATVLSTALPQ